MGGIPSGIEITSANLKTSGINSSVVSFGNSSTSTRAASSRVQRMRNDSSNIVVKPSWFTNSYGIGWNFGFDKKLMAPSNYSLAVLHQVYTLSTILGYRYAKKNGIPYAVFPHGSLTHYHESDSSFIKSIAKRLIISRILYEADVIIVTCTNESEDLEISLRAKTVLLPYGAVISKDSFENENTGFHNTLNMRILFSGRFDKKKNLPLLIAAMPLIVSKFPRLILDIAGTGSEVERSILVKLIHELNIEKNVEFHGWVDRSEMEQLFRSASLLVLPSENENFAQVVSEALSSGVPCVVSQFVGTSDIVARHDAGEIIEELTPESVAAAVLKVLEGDQLAYREAAFNATREDLDWSKIAAKWKALISSLAVE